MASTEPNEGEPAGRWSARPTYRGPTHIRHRDVPTLLWGDDVSGRVPDWVYVSNDKIHHLVFGLAPGARFGHSEAARTIFAADEFLYVLEGSLALVNPQFGEVCIAEQGHGVFFRKDTWHHGISRGPSALRVLEFFAPTPRTGASSAYARTKSLLTEVTYGDDRWLGHWPMSRLEKESAATMHLLTDDDALWRVDGDALVAIYISTEHLTAAKMIVPPGGTSTVNAYRGDLSVQVLVGQPHLLLVDEVDSNEQSWFELEHRDGFFIPEGTKHQVHNVTSESVELMMGVSPLFR